MILARRLVLTVAAALTLASGVVRAQVVDQVPGSAMALVKVTNLQALDTKVGNFLQQLGVVQLDPDLADPLAALEKQSGITQGLNTAGDLAVAIFDPADFTDPQAKADPTIGLLPVSDYKAFLSNFPDAKSADNLDTFTTKDGKTMFSAKWGDYAAIASTKEVLALKPGGLQVSDLAGKELDSKDLVLYANMPVLRTKLTAQLNDSRDQLFSSLKDKLSQDPKNAKYFPVVKAALNQVLMMATSFLRDANASTFSVNLGSDGIATTLLSDFAPDSYLGKLTASLKGVDGSLLNGLPGGKYLMFGGSTVDPAVSTKIISDLLDPIYTELVNLGPDGKPFTDYLDNVKAAVAKTTGETYGLQTPTGALGQDSLLQIIDIKRGDAAAIGDAFSKIQAQQTNIMSKFGASSAATVTVTPKAKTVDGVSFDQVQTQFNPDQNDPQQQQAAQMMSMMYGPNGLNVFIGQVDDKSLLTVSGLSDDGIKTTIESIKSDDDSMSKLPLVAQVAGQLPPTRLAEVYFPLDETVKSVMNYAQQFGFRAGVAPPPEVAPIGITLSTDGPVMRVDSYIPSQLVQTLTSMGLQIYMKFHSNQPGGQGGL